MSKNSKIYNDEINLLEIIINIWEGKWKVVSTIAITLLIVIIYQLPQKNKFTALTKIEIIDSLEEKNLLLIMSLLKVIWLLIS